MKWFNVKLNISLEEDYIHRKNKDESSFHKTPIQRVTPGCKRALKSTNLWSFNGIVWWYNRNLCYQRVFSSGCFKRCTQTWRSTAVERAEHIYFILRTIMWILDYRYKLLTCEHTMNLKCSFILWFKPSHFLDGGLTKPDICNKFM